MTKYTDPTAHPLQRANPERAAKADAGLNYVLEFKDSRGRWHRPRLPYYMSVAFAIKQGAHLSRTTFTKTHGYRVFNVETKQVEYVVEAYEALYV